VNRGICAVYRDSERQLVSLDIRGEPVDADRLYTVVLPSYHVRNAKSFLGVTQEELEARAKPKVVATSVQDVLREFLQGHQNLTSRVEGRLVYL
jgi:5'-nucleotidase